MKKSGGSFLYNQLKVWSKVLCFTLYNQFRLTFYSKSIIAQVSTIIESGS